MYLRNKKTAAISVENAAVACVIDSFQNPIMQKNYKLISWRNFTLA